MTTKEEENPAKEAVVAAFTSKVTAIIVEMREMFDAIGVPPEEQAPVFIAQLTTAAAQAAVHWKVNRATFDAVVRMMTDREFQPGLEPGVNSRTRGSA